MTKQYQYSLFIFRRDLRLVDNRGLHEAASLSAGVIPLFMFDPRQIGDKNPYKSDNCIQTMIQSLKDLEKSLRGVSGRLYYFYGEAEQVIQLLLIKNKTIGAVFFNRDYTPFSQQRDQAIERVCAERGVACHSYHDLLLTNPDDVRTGTGGVYKVFEAFYRHCRSSYLVEVPVALPEVRFITKRLSGEVGARFIAELEKETRRASNGVLLGGRSQAESILRRLPQHSEYRNTYNMPEFHTTGLSVHHKFGTISIRESYYAIVNALGKQTPLIRALYWRDFFTYIGYHFPQVFKDSFRQEYETILWSKSRKNFERWCIGETGFPIVDAGMRQLNATGYMHNRARLITASFLVKDLHINWQWGERYFAQKLADYDPCINNGNWQWVASTGVIAQPYFRIMNPWLQQKRYDPDCHYIKQWVLELAMLPSKIIQRLNAKNLVRLSAKYPLPMVNHRKASTQTLAAYRTK